MKTSLAPVYIFLLNLYFSVLHFMLQNLLTGRYYVIPIISNSSQWQPFELHSIQGASINLYAGVGVVKSSDPQSEWRELELKVSQV